MNLLTSLLAATTLLSGVVSVSASTTESHMLSSPGRMWTSSNSVSENNMFGTLTYAPVKDNMCDSNVDSYSGYYKIKGSYDQNYFYWFFEARNNPETAPTILWMTGGPGCSSILALLFENGPCSVSEDGSKTINNPYSWNENANIIWVDQPTGVGFSYGDDKDYINSEKQVAEDMFNFLQSFYGEFTQFQKNPFFIFGESYGGHYAPATAGFINQVNKEKKANTIQIPLAGLGVGNGLTAPEIQYKHYPEFYTNNSYNTNLITDAEVSKMESQLRTCQKLIDTCQKTNKMCAAAQGFCNNAVIAPYSATGLNVYDVRSKCEVPGLCYNFTNIDTFLTTPSVLEALHVDASKSAAWTSCNMQVNSDFSKDWMLSYKAQVHELLTDNIPVLIYAGDADFICNWFGNKAWTLALEWEGKEGFNKATDDAWMVDNKEAGQLRTYKNFHFLRVYEAGHMVPYDQPAVALDMVNSFMFGKLA